MENSLRFEKITPDRWTIVDGDLPCGFIQVANDGFYTPVIPDARSMAGFDSDTFETLEEAQAWVEEVL